MSDGLGKQCFPRPSLIALTHPRTHAPTHYRPNQYAALIRNTLSGRALNRFR